MTVKPITPDEVGSNKVNVIPEPVIECWNKMITKKYSSGSAVILQDHIIEAIMKAMNCDRSEVFAKDYLEIEDLYRANGWKVTYDKPRYFQNYPASFGFRKK